MIARTAVTFVAWMALAGASVAQQKARTYGLPAGAHVIELQSLAARRHADRALVLWMLKPTKYPTGYDRDEPYTCPDETRGSHYSGPTRVSLIDTMTNKVNNTINVIDAHLNDQNTFDIPYAIRKGPYYKIVGKPDRIGEAKPHIMFLKDYNGDGKAVEFSLFDALACMGLETTLIGYSETQDKVIQYPVSLEVIEGEKRSTEVRQWVDYLFSKKPIKSGYWKYEIVYRGRGGSLDKYEIRYNSKAERFEGTFVIQ